MVGVQFRAVPGGFAQQSTLWKPLASKCEAVAFKISARLSPGIEKIMNTVFSQAAATMLAAIGMRDCDREAGSPSTAMHISVEAASPDDFYDNMSEIQ